MSVTLDLSEEMLARLRAETERRHLSMDAVVEELAATLPAERGAGVRHRLSTATVSHVTEIPAAASEVAAAHFERLLALETDCWDVHESVIGGKIGWLDEGFELAETVSG